VLCENAVLRSWIFANDEAEKKEEAVTWSLDVKRMIDELEENLQVAIQEGSNAGSGGKDRKKLLEQVRVIGRVGEKIGRSCWNRWGGLNNVRLIS
jgi:hypothetical protein